MAPSAISTLERVASNDPLPDLRERAKTSATRIATAEAAKTAKADQAASVEEIKRRLEALEKEAERVRRAEAAHGHDELGKQ